MNTVKIVNSKKLFYASWKICTLRKKINILPACDFAVEEIRRKSGLKIPHTLLYPVFTVLAYFNMARYIPVFEKGYSKMLIWNGGKFRQQLAVEIAKLYGVKIYFYENGLLPETMVCDPKGINYNNSVPRKKEFYEHYFHGQSTLPKQLIPRKGKGREVFRGNKEKLPSKYIFVPFQVDYDTQIISHSPWIRDMRMLFAIIENIAKDSEYHFVFKEHPSSGIQYPDLHQRAKKHPTLMFANAHTTQELIEKSDAVITINSTVGIEALLFHKKVMVLGNAFYAIDGIAEQASSEEKIKKFLKDLNRVTIYKKLINHFLSYLYDVYLLKKDDTLPQQCCQRLFEDSKEMK